MWTKFKHSLSVFKRTQRKYEAVVLLHVDQELQHQKCQEKRESSR